MANSEKTKRPWHENVIPNAICVLGLLLFTFGFLVIAFQIVLYLKKGVWLELSLVSLAALGPDSFWTWLDSLTSWKGVSKIVYGILDCIPLSLFSIVLGWAIADPEVFSDERSSHLAPSSPGAAA